MRGKGELASPATGAGQLASSSPSSSSKERQGERSGDLVMVKMGSVMSEVSDGRGDTARDPMGDRGRPSLLGSSTSSVSRGLNSVMSLELRGEEERGEVDSWWSRESVEKEGLGDRGLEVGIVARGSDTSRSRGSVEKEGLGDRGLEVGSVARGSDTSMSRGSVGRKGIGDLARGVLSWGRVMESSVATGGVGGVGAMTAGRAVGMAPAAREEGVRTEGILKSWGDTASVGEGGGEGVASMMGLVRRLASLSFILWLGRKRRRLRPPSPSSL